MQNYNNKMSQEANGSSCNGGEATVTDNVPSVELLQHNRKILYFSDGTMEEDSSDSERDPYVADVTDKSVNMALNQRDVALMPQLKHKMRKAGSNILAGIDYVGGGLASLFGITTPKYASEIEHYKRSMANREVDVEENGNETWRRCEAGNALNRIAPSEVITTAPERGEQAQEIK